MDSQQYTLRVVNDSGRQWDMCLYQLYSQVATVFPVAWFVQSLQTTESATYTWSFDEWTFGWAETGILMPGEHFEFAQAWPADPMIRQPAGPEDAGDCVGLTRNNDGCTFYQLSSEPSVPTGQLLIQCDGTLPAGEISVGIGNSGLPVVAVQAEPNLFMSFDPLQPAYFIAAGTFQQGEVLDPATIPNPAQIVFSPNIDYMTAILELDGKWQIIPSQQSLDSVHGTSMVTP